MRTLPASVARRAVLSFALAAIAPANNNRPAIAAEDSSLWPKDGLFANCPQQDICVSSQDDRPQSWDNPWVFEGSNTDAYAKLKKFIEKKLNGRITAGDGERYMMVVFEDKSPIGTTTIDDAEFFFAPDDTLVQFRSSRRGDGAMSDFGANRKRLERARIALGWEKVPVLRNRRRALVVVESPLDSFGPALYTDVYSDTDPVAGAFKPPTAAERAWMRESDDRVRSR